MKWNWIAWLGVLALSFSTLTAQADYVLRIVHFPNLIAGAEPFDFAKLSQDPTITKILYPELTLTPGKETSIKDGRTIQVPTDYDSKGNVTKTEPKFCGQEVRATLKTTPTPKNFEVTFLISTITPGGSREVTSNGVTVQQPIYLDQRLNTTCFLREGMWMPMPLSAGPDNGIYAVQLLKK